MLRRPCAASTHPHTQKNGYIKTKGFNFRVVDRRTRVPSRATATWIFGPGDKGKRLAESGYTVLVINPYYRTAKGTIVPEGKTFSDPGIRELLMPLAKSFSPETCVTDGRAFVEYLDQQSAVDTNRKIGTTGYCMTGSYTMRLAPAMPDRIGAGGSFHGGGLATDTEDSPHLLAPKMQAGFLIAIAENDDERNPEEKVLLREAFDNAGVSAEIEVYKGTQHGWCPPDSAVYNEQQAEHAWSRMLDLFSRELS